MSDNLEAIETYRKYKTKVEQTAEYVEHFDILETITNVGNDEVFTPRKVCDAMLDSLPEEVWHHPEYHWLNPASKNGIFEREIALRLDQGLKDIIPDELERKKHILQNMIFSIGLTKFTALVARRTLYYCSYANRKDDGMRDSSDGHSVNGYAIGNGTWFEDEEGNVKTPKAEHVFGNDGRCIHCGINRSSKYADETQLEHYAYEFIHQRDIHQYVADTFFGGNKDMKFDIIIGNPPYQLDDGGAGASAKPIYQLFIQRAIELNPRYLCMIIPARWYAGGKGLDEFRKQMLSDRHMRTLVDFPNSQECFSNFNIAGGVCYFLWDSSHIGECNVFNFKNGLCVSSSKRNLDEFPILIRNNYSLAIIQKIKKKATKFLSEKVFARNYFSIPTTIEGTKNKDGVPCLTSKGLIFLQPNLISDKKGIFNKYKIVTTYAMSGGNKPSRNGKYQVLSSLQILNPGVICSETYLILDAFEDENIANNYLSYATTKFYRYLLLQSLTSIHITKDTFALVPDIDLNNKITDDFLSNLFDLSDDDKRQFDQTITEISDKED